MSYLANFDTPLTFACYTENAVEVRRLLSLGVNPNQRTAHNIDTALTTAIKYNRSLEIISLLLQFHVDVNSKTSDGSTALMACSTRTDNLSVTVARMLISSNALLEDHNNNGFTSLLIAVEHKNLDLVKYFISIGANIQHRTNFGNTALHFACMNDDWKMFNYLGNNNAHVDVTDNNGNTILHLAASNYTTYVAKRILLSTIGQLFATVRNRFGQTPLHIACSQYDSVDMVHLLLPYSDISLPDNDNNTPLDIAILKGNYNVVEILSSYNLTK